jgi:hypothetical protein
LPPTSCQRDLVRLFATGGDVYRQMAAEIPGRPAEAIAKGSLERQLGKATILGCGYQLGATKFVTTCANAGITIDEAMAERVVQTYRATNDRIVALWAELERAAPRAVDQPELVVAAASGRVRLRVKAGFLWLMLPSGRPLAYASPAIEHRETPWGELRPQVTYLGVNSLTRAWERQTAYGGKWTATRSPATCWLRPCSASNRPAIRSSSPSTTRSWPRCRRASAASRSSSKSCASSLPGQPAARSPPKAGAASGTGSDEGDRHGQS